MHGQTKRSPPRSVTRQRRPPPPLPITSSQHCADQGSQGRKKKKRRPDWRGIGNCPGHGIFFGKPEGTHWKSSERDLAGAPSLGNSPCGAGDAGSIPDRRGTKIPQATGQRRPHTTTTEGPACCREAENRGRKADKCSQKKKATGAHTSLPRL